MTFKNQVMPRLLTIMTEQTIPLNLKEEGCTVLIEILSVLDRNFLRDNILKALQSLRENINEPTICMHLLTLYNGIASALTPEDIGNKILPGLIPMLISASFTKAQFNKLISTIRALIDQLEKHRLKDLSEMDPLGESELEKGRSQQKDIFSGLGNFDDPNAALPPRESEGDFDFLSVLEGTAKKQTPKKSEFDNGRNSNPAAATTKSDAFSGFGDISGLGAAETQKPKSDIFKGVGIAPPNSKPASKIGGFDPFDTSGPPKPIQKPSHSLGGGGIDPFSTDPFDMMKPKKTDNFGGFGGSKPVQAATGMPTPTINMTSGFKSLNDHSDPFADLEREEIKVSSGFGGFDSGISFTGGFGAT